MVKFGTITFEPFFKFKEFKAISIADVPFDTATA